MLIYNYELTSMNNTSKDLKFIVPIYNNTVSASYNHNCYKAAELCCLTWSKCKVLLCKKSVPKPNNNFLVSLFLTGNKTRGNTLAIVTCGGQKVQTIMNV